jgi:DNA modification methylase
MTNTPFHRLVIDHEFHRLLYPMPNVHRQSDDNMQDRERTRRAEWRSMHRGRYEQVAAKLKDLKVVTPFKVWVTKEGKRIIIDGRHYEYSAAVRLGFAITDIEVPCESREHAKSFMIAECLLDGGRPRHSDYYRIQLASQCKYIMRFAKDAASNRGRRSDLLARETKSQPRDTRKQIAMLAGCGATTVRKALKLGSEGAIYFEPQRWRDIENALVVGDMAIGSAFRKLEGEADLAFAEAQREMDNGKIPLSVLSGEEELEENIEEEEEDEDAEVEDSTNEQSTRKKRTAKPSAIAHAKAKLGEATVRADRRQENIKRLLTSFPFENPDLETLDWNAANKILRGDNAEIMSRMPSGIASLVFGSPPYPVPKEYEGTDYAKPLQQWLDKDIAPVVTEAARVLREGGRLVLQVADCFELEHATETHEDSKRKRSAVYLPVLAKLINYVESLDLGFLYRETKVWLKFIRPARAPMGSLGSPSDPKSYNSHEWIIVWSLRSHHLTPPSANAPTGMTKDFYRQRSVGAWYYAPVSSNKLNHPCPFPNGLATDVIKLFSWPTDLIVDPWSGSGTTAAMAAKLGRRWIGIDVEDSYCRGANVRVHEELRQRQKRLALSLETAGASDDAETDSEESSD